MRTIFSISHFGVDLYTFARLVEFYPKGDYRDLGGDCVVFKMKNRTAKGHDIEESWFLEDADIGEWRGEEE